MRTTSMVLLIVLALASVASAQVTFTPSADVGILTLKLTDADDEVTEKASVTQLGLGVVADVGHGIAVEGAFGYGMAGELDNGGEVDNHTVTTLSVGARYTAYEGNGFAVGPVLNYQNSNWKYELAGDEVSTAISGLGVGVFAAYDIDPIVVSASYIHRFNTKAVVKFGGIESESEGTGSYVAIGASYPVSDVLTLNGAYEADVQFSDDDGSQVLSGFKIGATYAF